MVLLLERLPGQPALEPALLAACSPFQPLLLALLTAQEKEADTTDVASHNSCDTLQLSIRC